MIGCVLVALFHSMRVGSTPELGEGTGGCDRPTPDPLLLDRCGCAGGGRPPPRFEGHRSAGVGELDADEFSVFTMSWNSRGCDVLGEV